LIISEKKRSYRENDQKEHGRARISPLRKTSNVSAQRGGKGTPFVEGATKKTKTSLSERQLLLSEKRSVYRKRRRLYFNPWCERGGRPTARPSSLEGGSDETKRERRAGSNTARGRRTGGGGSASGEAQQGRSLEKKDSAEVGGVSTSGATSRPERKGYQPEGRFANLFA